MKKRYYTPVEIEIIDYSVEEGFAESMPALLQGPGPGTLSNPPDHPDGPYSGIGPSTGGNDGGYLGGGAPDGSGGGGWDPWDI